MQRKNRKKYAHFLSWMRTLCVMLCLGLGCSRGQLPKKFELKLDTTSAQGKAIKLTITPLEGAPKLHSLLLEIRSNERSAFFVSGSIEGEKSFENEKGESVPIWIGDIVAERDRTIFEQHGKAITLTIHYRKPNIKAKIAVTGGACEEVTKEFTVL